MARIAGIDLPKNKKISIALTYIFGIGKSQSQKILESVNIDLNLKTNSLTEEQVLAIRNEISSGYSVEGELRSAIGRNIKRLVDVGTYRGLRHKKKLPVHGQRTHTNARTRKGKGIAIANRKKVTA